MTSLPLHLEPNSPTEIHIGETVIGIKSTPPSNASQTTNNLFDALEKGISEKIFEPLAVREDLQKK